MLALLALAAITLSGCTPAPEPTPTSAFASEEDAFAAAEEVYRAYWEVSGSVDTTDPNTFEALYALTTDGVNEADRESLSAMYAEGYIVTGITKVVAFTGKSSDAPYDEVVGVACLDVRDVAVVDAHGKSRISPDRPDVYALEIGFTFADDRLLISSSKRIDDPACAV